MEATGIKSRSTLYKIRKHGPKSPVKRGPKRKRIVDSVDDFDRGVIRRLISNMYIEKKWPTINSIYDEVKIAINFQGSKSSLRTILKDMGYKYSKRPERLVKERPDIVAKRHDYLSKMKQIRQLTNCPVVYLDETFLHQNHTKSKCWVIAGSGGFLIPTGKGSRLIILHAGSKEGFVQDALLSFQSKTGSSDYHDEMNGNVFLEWFTHQFLPNIPQHTVIVMDNAPYHSVQEERIPTMNTKKAEMQEWLTAQNVDWCPTMIKVQLYALIQMHKPRCTKMVIDELARSHGHYILRLPPYHCELNPIELIWGQVKGDVATKNSTFKMVDVKKHLENALANVTPENWAKAEQHVIKLEEEMYNNEVRIDTTLPEDQLNSFRFQIEVDDSSSEESDSDSEDDDAYASAPEFPAWSLSEV
ncbi:uncharacterized protein [Amphiura filiformis]|uniref:uncharacterized protein n=1 Tax=Amphiura filiformis TaxID=82378 RepID=UPI003B2109A5